MSNTVRHFPNTYADLQRKLKNRPGGRPRVSLCNNTTAEWSWSAPGGKVDHPERVSCIVVRLHGHCIARFWADGTVEVSDAGWQTVTTKQRLNVILRPFGLRVVQSHYQWSLWSWETGQHYPWDGSHVIDAEPPGGWAEDARIAQANEDRRQASGF